MMKVQELFSDLRERQESILQQRMTTPPASLDDSERQLGDLKLLVEIEGKLTQVVEEALSVLGKKDLILPLVMPRPDGSRKNGKRALDPGVVLETSYKGKVFRAEVNQDGKIVYDGSVYQSIAALSVVITGKEKSHLRSRKFWKITPPQTILSH